jgi:hypothetical protein
MGRFHDARRPVGRAAEEIVIAALDNAEMQPGTHPQCNRVGCGQLLQSLLQNHRGIERVDRVFKGGIHSVACHLDDFTAVVFDGRPGRGIVGRKSARHSLPVLFPQAGASLNIRKKKRSRAG